MSGLTSQGFQTKTFDEIKNELIQSFESFYGPINTSPESAIGQQINIQAEREAELWDAMQAIYNSQYPDTASGLSLDYAVQLTFITRRAATKTQVDVNLTGTAGTLIAAGSQASDDAGNVYELRNDVTLDSNGDGSGVMLALEEGSLVVLANTLTNIETPISGWDTVNNPQDGTTGRDRESDDELRNRRQNSLTIASGCTVEGIRSRLLTDVDNVISARVIENPTENTDNDGRPPHSFEAIVGGGDQQDIADKIWETKPAGIQTYGNTTVIVTDSQGIDHAIDFSRPIQVFIWAKITLEPNGVGTFPSNSQAESIAKEKIVEFGNTLSVGDNVIYQALYCPIYDNLDGLKSVTIELAKNSNPNSQPSAGQYASQNITIAADEVSEWAEDRIDVTIV